MGAAGRDFHNFNVFFRDADDYKVVAFTATQIPHITDRKYPSVLAGKLYPDGIPILDEDDLDQVIKSEDADLVVFSYSDIPHVEVMHKASQVIAAGSDFMLLGARSTWIESKKPLISVCATRTGSGKSQTTRKICEVLEAAGKKVVVIRHPMPYGDLAKQAVQRFATHEDLDKHECTIEEREEYEPHIDEGRVVYAGVDYGAILAQAEAEADIVIWDGGNNDLPFYQPDLNIVVVDPHRPDDQTTSHPGEANLRMADVVVINKVDTAPPENVERVKGIIASVNPEARIIIAASPISADAPDLIKGKRVLVVEDGPTLTHGGMKFGAGVVAARKFGAAECIDPRGFAVGEIKQTLEKYDHIEDLVPAMGYGEGQTRDLEATIRASGADVVINGTPADLRLVIKIDIPIVRVTYKLEEVGKPDIQSILTDFLKGEEAGN
ncbi:MAG: cyclic 2,3-diphosphoglycerate synthase [Candidatus Eisenbacteria bacterium]